MKAHLFGITQDGRSVPVRVDSQGYLGGGASGGPAASADALGWKYTAASGGITNTSDAALAAAAGAGKCNYLSSIQITNASATGTEVVVKDGSTVIWRGYAGQNVSHTYVFPRPLVGSPNTALNVACITNSTQTYVNAQGFIAGPPNEIELATNAYEEVVNYIGTLVVTDAGEQIALAA